MGSQHGQPEEELAHAYQDVMGEHEQVPPVSKDWEEAMVSDRLQPPSPLLQREAHAPHSALSGSADFVGDVSLDRADASGVLDAAQHLWQVGLSHNLLTRCEYDSSTWQA